MIHCCMDNNRKQEIQNQIAELQRELAGITEGIEIVFGNWVCCNREYRVRVKSLSDSDIIDALSSHPDIRKFGDSDVTVVCETYRKVFHVTKVVSYNITPF